MPFVDQGPLEVFTKPLPNRVAEDRPSFLGAALRQTEIASLFRLLQPDESTQYSPTFNDKFKVLAKQSRFFADFPDEFVGVGSENDFIRVEQALAARHLPHSSSGKINRAPASQGGRSPINIS